MKVALIVARHRMPWRNIRAALLPLVLIASEAQAVGQPRLITSARHKRDRVASRVVHLPSMSHQPPTQGDSSLTLWYRQPASEWNRALPVGNGRLGAMVFGGQAEEIGRAHV